MDPEAVARGTDAGSLGTEVPQQGSGADPLVGVRGQSPRKRGSRGVSPISLTYSDYLTIDLVFNFALTSRTCTLYKG